MNNEDQQLDENGISCEMVDNMISVFTEGINTDAGSMRSLLYCVYREARKIERSYMSEPVVKYRYLIKGELIEHGDEILDDEKGWINTISCVGMHAPDPAYTSHRQYRRRLRGNFSDDKPCATVAIT